MSQRSRANLRFESRREQLSERIIRAVADAEGVDPTELDAPLYRAIDPDALDALFRSLADRPGATGCIQFEYHGYGVVVDDDGQLTLTER